MSQIDAETSDTNVPTDLEAQEIPLLDLDRLIDADLDRVTGTGSRGHYQLANIC